MVKIEPGKQCWLYEDGMLFIVHIVNPIDDVGYRVEYESGLDKGEQSCKNAVHLYLYPEDKTRLLDDIEKDIEYLRLLKSNVILERKVI